MSVGAANQPPEASLTTSCDGLTCTFDGSGSRDADGSIVAYAWDFGDGGSGSGVSVVHTYGAPGSYSVVLTVEDDRGALGIAKTTVNVEAGNQAPVASFTYGCNGLVCTFDGSGSSDADGDPLTYAWDFGDGGSGSGVTASHSYGVPGAFEVKLTVQDDGDADDSDWATVTVSAGSPVLSATGYRLKAYHYVDLTWTTFEA